MINVKSIKLLGHSEVRKACWPLSLDCNTTQRASNMKTEQSQRERPSLATALSTSVHPLQPQRLWGLTDYPGTGARGLACQGTRAPVFA